MITFETALRCTCMSIFVRLRCQRVKQRVGNSIVHEMHLKLNPFHMCAITFAMAPPRLYLQSSRCPLYGAAVCKWHLSNQTATAISRLILLRHIYHSKVSPRSRQGCVMTPALIVCFFYKLCQWRYLLPIKLKLKLLHNQLVVGRYLCSVINQSQMTLHNAFVDTGTLPVKHRLYVLSSDMIGRDSFCWMLDLASQTWQSIILQHSPVCYGKIVVWLCRGWVS